MPRLSPTAAGAVAAVLLQFSGAAQQEAPSRPASDPQLRSEGVESTLESMRRRDGAAPPPVAPTRTRAPAPEPPAAGQARQTAGASGVATRSWREGAFIAERGGVLIRAQTGDWVFVPRPTEGGAIDPPLILLPSRNLEQLEGLLDPGEPRPGVRLSGQVFSYRGRDYLLVGEASAPMTEERAVSEAAAAEPGDADAPKRAEDLVRELESREARPRALPRLAAGAAPSVSDRPGPADGSLITARRGRVVRLPDGELAFTPDNDSRSPDGPMPLAPCSTLSRMEAVSLWREDGVPMEVSGRVLVYRGKRYFLPTMYVVRQPGDVSPLQ